MLLDTRSCKVVHVVFDNEFFGGTLIVYVFVLLYIDCGGPTITYSFNVRL